MSVVQKQDGVFTALHSICSEATIPRAAEYEHRRTPVHCINRADTRLKSSPTSFADAFARCFAMYFTVVHSVQIPRTTGQYMKLCNLKVLHEALPLVLLAIVVQVPALFRGVLVLAQLVAAQEARVCFLALRAVPFPHRHRHSRLA